MSIDRLIAWCVEHNCKYYIDGENEWPTGVFVRVWSAERGPTVRLWTSRGRLDQPELALGRCVERAAAELGFPAPSVDAGAEREGGEQ